jgi:hypothetical protein
MHKFTFEFNDHKETFPVWDEWNMADQELEVKYEIRDGRVSIDSVKVRVDTCTGFQTIELIHILSALSGLLDIKIAAESDVMRRNVEKMHKNYPELYREYTQEERAEMLKLK